MLKRARIVRKVMFAGISIIIVAIFFEIQLIRIFEHPINSLENIGRRIISCRETPYVMLYCWACGSSWGAESMTRVIASVAKSAALDAASVEPDTRLLKPLARQQLCQVQNPSTCRC